MQIVPTADHLDIEDLAWWICKCQFDTIIGSGPCHQIVHNLSQRVRRPDGTELAVGIIEGAGKQNSQIEKILSKSNGICLITHHVGVIRPLTDVVESYSGTVAVAVVAICRLEINKLEDPTRGGIIHLN